MIRGITQDDIAAEVWGSESLLDCFGKAPTGAGLYKNLDDGKTYLVSWTFNGDNNYDCTLFKNGGYVHSVFAGEETFNSILDTDNVALNYDKNTIPAEANINISDALVGTDTIFNRYFDKSGSGTIDNPFIITPKMDVSLANRIYIIRNPSEPTGDVYITLKGRGYEKCLLQVIHNTVFSTLHYHIIVRDQNGNLRPRFNTSGTYSVAEWVTTTKFDVTLDLNDFGVYYTRGL